MTKKSNRKNPSAPCSKVRALIPLDTAKIRKSELNKLKHSKKTCATLADQVAQFEKKEAPAFSKWIHTQCGPILSKINSLRTESFSLQNTLHLAEELCATFPQYTMKECADAAVYYIETKGKIPAGFEFFFEDAPSDESGADDPFGSFDDELDEEGADAARKFFDSLFDDFDDAPEFDGPDPFAPTKRQKQKWAEEEKSVKKLYRKIIRKLHPDRAGSSTPEQQELWHAAKKAYETNDLQTLQHIEANCDLLNEKLIRFASIASIRSGTNFYKQSCTQIRRTLRTMKKQPEWGFLSWTETKKNKVIKHYLQDLDDDLYLLTLNHSAMQRELDRMRRAPRKNMKPKKSRDPDFFEFF